MARPTQNLFHFQFVLVFRKLAKERRKAWKERKKTKRVTSRGGEKNQMIVPWKEERKAPLVRQKETKAQLVREVKKKLKRK